MDKEPADMADPLFAKVESILLENLNVPQDKIRPEANLQHDLGLDSFAAVELGFAVEEEFNIEVADDEMASIKTIADLVKAIRKKAQG
jgi:acyl carrier protein